MSDEIAKKQLRVVLPASDSTGKPTGLALMREPFPAHQISKLPKPTKAQTDAVRKDFKQGIRCEICGGWHHPKVVHLDYVGHAALTDRLLDCDPGWNWKPRRTDEFGAPVFDKNGGMWIELTVCGVTRLGYGHADGKQGGDAIKEVIGDALRNAAMRFGAALDLWHKGDLYGHEEVADTETENKPATITEDQFKKLTDTAKQAGVDADKICGAFGAPSLQEFPAQHFDSAMKKLNLTISQKPPEQPTIAEQIGDEIPDFDNRSDAYEQSI